MSTMVAAWNLGICLCMITLAHCIPIDVVYRGDGCECPTKHEYEINIPKLPKHKPYAPAEYGYQIDVPIQARGKAKMSYSFDFMVEEPRTPKPQKESKWNLYTKVDRITVNRGDCENDNYNLPQPSHPKGCSCAACDGAKHFHRYVLNKMSTCKCNRPDCKCHMTNALSPKAAYTARRPRHPPPMNGGNNIRRKRDLQRAIFRPRKAEADRPGRFVKMYHKNLYDAKGSGLFGMQKIGDPPSSKSKRKFKKAHSLRLRPRIVKRDIKGEYDLLEKEREQMDLTLPEIIQFMPETLQPDFKRGPCNFGNSACQQSSGSGHFRQHKDPQKTLDPVSNTESDTEEATSDTHKEHKEHKEKNEKMYEEESPMQNSITATYTKRNAATYNQPIAPKSAASAPSISSAQLLGTQSAYNAQSMPPIPTKPIWTLPSTALQSAYSAPQPLATAHYWYDHLGHKYLEQNGRLSLVATTSSVRDPTGSDTTPLQYAGDLEVPDMSRSSLVRDHSLLGASPIYPVQYVSNAELDRIIEAIIYRHPDFIDATSHYGGALVDPEPLQEQQTKEFLKKLIDGRLRIWFSEEEHHRPFSAPQYRNPYNPLSRYYLQLPTP